MQTFLTVLTTAGLGLDYDTLRLQPTSQEWVDAGSRLRDRLADLLVNLVVGVE
jgi:hypothetical protein